MSFFKWRQELKKKKKTYLNFDGRFGDKFVVAYKEQCGFPTFNTRNTPKVTKCQQKWIRNM